jgi:hypothetical protein
MKRTTFRPNNLLDEGLLERNEQPLGQRFLKRRLSHVWASLFLWNPASSSTVGPNIGIYFSNRRGKRREREQEQMGMPPLPQVLWALFIGGGDDYLYFILLIM